MNDKSKSESPASAGAVGEPLLASYDSGYEHSLDHWIELQHLLDEAENGPAPFTLAPSRT